jgi:hypothetical protein
MTASRFIARLGSSSALRPAYDEAERNQAKDDDHIVQPGGHTESMGDAGGISKYN